MNIFISQGYKRKLTTLLASVIEVLSALPGTGQVVAVLAQVNAFLGGAAVLHGAGAKTLSEEKLAVLVSAIYALIAIAYFVPALYPFIPALQKAAGLLATAKVGSVLLK